MSNYTTSSTVDSVADSPALKAIVWDGSLASSDSASPLQDAKMVRPYEQQPLNSLNDAATGFADHTLAFVANAVFDRAS